ncbi:hypothetical protein MuYL_1342 [Mucilaginibacter xinganensis]|uniref:Uncharacterized protein n=1 Tax=Mucilaginibacter xinganensis TaxID=1234841 RepID=A0A223NTZ8_9SPHI|nr:hypothetical protein MuYL_1342 [Mucilaginibacter xinganensis]
MHKNAAFFGHRIKQLINTGVIKLHLFTENQAITSGRNIQVSL